MITITSSDLAYILSKTPADQNIMLVGKHGIGKSEIITNFYREHGMKVVPLFLGQMSDPGDIIGLPHKNIENGQTEFMPPYWFPVDGTPIVLFLDELNRARPEILQVVQDLVLNKTIAGRTLPAGSVIVSAINAGDEYTLTDIDPALLSRFNVYHFAPTTTDWIKWAEHNGVNMCVVDFIASHDTMLDPKMTAVTDTTTKNVDRRSWKRVSDFLNMNPGVLSDGSTTNLLSLRKTISGMVGEVVGAAFCDFIQDGNFVSPETALFEFDKCVGAIRHYDILQMTTLTIRVCGFVNRLADVTKDDNDRAKIASALVRYLKFLNSDDKDKRPTNSTENAMFFVGEYETGAYPMLGALINEYDELDDYVSSIIDMSEY